MIKKKATRQTLTSKSKLLCAQIGQKTGISSLLSKLNRRHALLLAVPLTVVFDLVVLLWTQQGCLNPQCVQVFMQTSSLTYSIVQGVLPGRR